MNRPRAAIGFTLVELLVVIAIIVLLAALLLPALARSVAGGRSAQCQSNLRQWNVALAIYLVENNDTIPRRGQGVQPLDELDRPADWFNCLPPLAGLPAFRTLAHGGKMPRPGDKTIYVCPDARPTQYTNFLPYAMNIYLSPWVRPQPHRLPEIPRPSLLPFMADGPCAYSAAVPSALAYTVTPRHARRANVAFLDGHVVSFSGDYLGCGVGERDHPDIHWATESDGINHEPVP
jgi:prepilin-type processing-associated H-X9-DG protein/prepilin-type N-terminal cleavage/methylation domain-containing protein